MASKHEIKEQLDKYYEEYQKNSDLNLGKSKEVDELLKEYYSCKDISANDLAFEIARFSKSICNYLFDYIIKTCKAEADSVDEIITALFNTEEDNKLKKQFYIQKYVNIAIIIIASGHNPKSKYKTLPTIVVKIAKSINKDNFNRFYHLINKTSGSIFKIEYSNDLDIGAIWNAVNLVYKDLSKSQYYTMIYNWALKYGFITSEPKTSPAEEQPTDNPADAGDDTKPVNEEPHQKEAAEKGIATEAKAENTILEEQSPSESVPVESEQLINKIENESKLIKNAVAAGEMAVKEVITKLRNEIACYANNQETAASMRERIAALEAELRAEKEKQAALKLAAIEHEKKEQEYTGKIAELEAQLKEAFEHNDRESSLEAEKLRTELTRSLQLCYDDWLEYEQAEFSENNYESLQSIIKQVFKALDKINIKFKGE